MPCLLPRAFPAALASLAAAALACSASAGSSTPPDPPPAGCTAGGWPTAATTGIPAGTPELQVLSDASIHTTGAGQVLDAVELRGRLYVDHPGVIVRRSRLVGDVYYAVYATEGGTGLTIEDSEIVGGVLIPDGFTGRRNHLHAPDGGTKDDGWIFAASDVTLEDNLIDGLVGDAGAHLDGIQVMAGSNLVIRHNWIEAVSPPISGGGVNAAIFLGPDFGEISDVVIDCNMLIEEDGYYPLRLDARGLVAVRHNRWRRGHLGSPALAVDTAVTAWEDNAYEDGEVIETP
jgi:hypothetical protein